MTPPAHATADRRGTRTEPETPSLADLPEPRAPRYEALTTWRGVACLMVVVYHSIFTGYERAVPEGDGVAAIVFAVLQRGWIGVPLFFVISGYCVTASADAARRRLRPGVTFFWRRFRRIYPPYWAWFAVAASAVVLVERLLASDFFGTARVPNPEGLSAGQWFGNLTLTETWRWHFGGGTETAFLSPSWTLCYEEQFYAVVGLVLLIAPRFFFASLAAITALVAAGLLAFPLLGIRTEGLFLDGKWLMFAAGVLAYYALNYALNWGRCVAGALLGLAALAAAADPLQLLRPRVNEPNLSYLVAFLFALLILGAKRWDGWLTDSTWVRPLRFCGAMCYSLYLIHWPVVTVVGHGFDRLGLKHPVTVLCVTVPACVAVAVGMAWGFHTWIERRFMNAPYLRSTSKKPRAAVALDAPAPARPQNEAPPGTVARTD